MKKKRNMGQFRVSECYTREIVKKNGFHTFCIRDIELDVDDI